MAELETSTELVNTSSFSIDTSFYGVPLEVEYRSVMVGTGTRAAVGVSQPIRQSPRKASHPSAPIHNAQSAPLAPAPAHLLPTPLSNSPSTSSLNTQSRYPPHFDQSHPMHFAPAPPGPASLSHSVSVSARASTALYTPRSPYRPGEYGRVDRRPETTSERTKIERRLFGEDEDELMRMREEEEEEEEGWKRNRGSSPLQPAFEARLILRKGAPVDLISWLRRNFHHIPSPSHPSLTSSTSLLAIRALLAERFPRLPESEELVKAVTAAFPRVHMDYGPVGSEEPPMIRGLVWNGKETVYEDVKGEKEKEREKGRASLEAAAATKGKGVAAITPDKRGGRGRQINTSIGTQHAQGHHYKNAARQPTANGFNVNGAVSRSPTQSTLVSPTTSSSRRILPNTPARSVLEEFAVLATLADKSPVHRTQSLPGDRMAVPSMAYKLASICDSFGGEGDGEGESSNARASSKRKASASGVGGKRRASTPPPGHDSTTPDKLEGLLAAAETIEGSPMASFLDNDGEGRASGQHKRRRTIGGMGSMREIIDGGSGRKGKDINGDREGSPGKRGGPSRMLGWGGSGGLAGVPEHGEDEPMGQGEAGGSAAVAPKAKGKGRAAAGTSGRGRGRGRGGKAKAGGRAHADSNASQKSISAVSALLPPPIPSGSNTPMDLDGGADTSALGLGLSDPSQPPTYAASGSGTPFTGNQSLPPPSPSTPHPNYPRARKSNELPTEGLYPGIDCKPPHPYHEMIRHAIESAPDRRLQLSQIYSSIADRFPFFAALDERKTAGWQNSIRHNLSLKKMFVRVNKVDGIPDEGGKGGWWTVEPGIPDEGRPGRKSKAVASGPGTVDPLAGPGPAWKGRKSDGDVSAVSGEVGSVPQAATPAPAEGDSKQAAAVEEKVEAPLATASVVPVVGGEKAVFGPGVEGNMAMGLNAGM